MESNSDLSQSGSSNGSESDESSVIDTSSREGSYGFSNEVFSECPKENSKKDEEEAKNFQNPGSIKKSISSDESFRKYMIENQGKSISKEITEDINQQRMKILDLFNKIKENLRDYQLKRAKYSEWSEEIKNEFDIIELGYQ